LKIALDLQARLRAVVSRHIPLPAQGRTPERLRILVETAREDLTLAKLAEAHWDAVAILAEAGRTPAPSMLYGVWASELPGEVTRLEKTPRGFCLTGTKPFCSGIGLVDRALVTVNAPGPLLVEVDMSTNREHIVTDLDIWKVDAFRATRTGSLTFRNALLAGDAQVGGTQWYLDRVGFWHGACGPAACWLGGIFGLLDHAAASKRDDPHTLAHLAAMHASAWAMMASVDRAGVQIDQAPNDRAGAHILALQLRYIIEHLGTEVLHRFAGAYGPQPLSMNQDIATRFQEVQLYMRQSHGDRDLEALGRLIKVLGSPQQS
jgi:hypothetical protein